MSKKVAYEPHRRLATKMVPSATEYDRKDTRKTIEQEVAESFFDNPDDDISAYYDFMESLYERGVILDA